MDDVPTTRIVMTLWRGSDGTMSRFVMPSLPRPGAAGPEGAAGAAKRNAHPVGTQSA